MMKKYPLYKNSEIESIGEIPDGWKISKVKWELDFHNNKRVPIESVERFNRQGKYPYYGASGIIDFVDDFIFEGEFILVGEDGANILSRSTPLAFLANGKFWVNNHAHILKAKYGNDKFYCHQLELNDFSSISSGSAQPKLTKEALANVILVTPSPKEQDLIINFLDHQTSLIDTIISKKEKLIELLKEKRQAVINEAVTKGLDPSAKMKDSGIEWLGEIPEGWVKRDLQSVVLNNQYSLTGGPFGSDLKHEEYTDEGVQIIQLNNIGVGEFKNDNQIFTSEEKADQLVSCNIFPGDIIVAKMADPVARACIMPDFDERYLMASDGIRLEVNKDQFNTKFLEYAINANYFNLQAELNSTGTTRLRIGLTTFKKLKLVTPELEEQNQIVDYLEKFNSRFQSIVTMTKQQIDKLKTYRESLISEAVTGKIDVRDWEPLKSINE